MQQKWQNSGRRLSCAWCSGGLDCWTKFGLTSSTNALVGPRGGERRWLRHGGVGGQGRGGVLDTEVVEAHGKGM